MYFQHVYDKSLAQASYVVGCQATGEAVVIDAKRDVDTYLEIAQQNKLKITHIFETHIHADFLAGSRELAALTGAKMYLSAEGGEGWTYNFPHEPLKHKDVVMVGNLKFEVLHTPGHTPESISFLLTDVPASNEPVMLFTGDFVFVGDVGRPDLLEKAAGFKGTQEVGAHQLFESLEKFKAIKDYVQVWPGHGAGSACGKALGAVPSSTVGYERIRNWALQYGHDEKGFTKELLSGQPEPPKYFAMMKRMNKEPRPLLTQVPQLKKITIEDVKAALQKGMMLIDTRDKNAFASGFIPGSINIQGNESFNTWAGWYLNYEEPFMLIVEEAKKEDITRKLMRIGLDNVHGYITSVEEWQKAGGVLQKADVIGINTFKQLKEKDGVQVVDLRSENEYKEAHMEGAKNVFVGTLPDNLDQIDKSKEVIVHCQGGDRAAIGYSYLSKAGFKNIKNFSGGMKEWKEAGNAVTRA